MEGDIGLLTEKRKAATKGRHRRGPWQHSGNGLSPAIRARNRARKNRGRDARAFGPQFIGVSRLSFRNARQRSGDNREYFVRVRLIDATWQARANTPSIFLLVLGNDKYHTPFDQKAPDGRLVDICSRNDRVRAQASIPLLLKTPRFRRTNASLAISAKPTHENGRRMTHVLR